VRLMGPGGGGPIRDEWAGRVRKKGWRMRVVGRSGGMTDGRAERKCSWARLRKPSTASSKDHASSDIWR
jgi:hypothetical protein